MYQQSIPNYKVGELTNLIKNKLEQSFPIIRVQGEISGFKPASSGHCYFSLKDKDALINCVLFRRERINLNITPKDGQLVNVIGRLTLYPQRGAYQIICETIEAIGQGEILQILEERKKRLQQEGLFSQDKKRELPPYPQIIGVISSGKGAAYRDILHVLNKRMKGYKIVLWNTRVQGELAAKGIIDGIKALNKRSDVDLILLSRGGGSIEDLLPFSDEEVVRAVRGSKKPTICGVGHEIDFPLVDFACDFRAPTPSAAAQVISDNWAKLFEKLSFLSQSITTQYQGLIQKKRFSLQNSSQEKLNILFKNIIQNLKLKIDDPRREITLNLSLNIKEKEQKIALLKQSIVDGSPQAILKKGYALISSKEGEESRIIHHINGVKNKKDIKVRLYDGSFRATISPHTIKKEKK